MYFERIGFSGDSSQLVAEISEEFNLGHVRDSSVLTVGFEDCNVRIQTDSGPFVIKAFGKFRTDEEIERYVDVMKSAVEGGVHHPALHFTQGKNALFRHKSGVSVVAMDFINGKTYFDMKSTPNDEELSQIAAEAAKIHALNLSPPHVKDSWAHQNIHGMYETVLTFLDDDDRRLVQQAVLRYDALNTSQLTTCFVHGDIISTNTLKDKNGKIWILDFSVSNIYPKIQELSVIATSLLGDMSEFVPLNERAARVRTAYLAAGGELSDYDQQALLDYAIAGAAMELMGGHKAKIIDKEDPEESEHWIALGREALEEALT